MIEWDFYMELWDLYDREGNKTDGTWERKHGNNNDLPEGRYHLVCDILVKHTDGSYLLTKRHPDKDICPGFWEPGAGGAAQQGEGPEECALRELFEETGLKADCLEFVSRSVSDFSHSIYFSYLAIVSSDKDSVVLQEGETTDYKWVDAKGLLEYADSDLAMKQHVERYRDYLNELGREITS
ncbi:MAG: NUDIX hydrolase [Clostridiales bacterium]|nr:NUDIX hydrolase [Clostridiales bacterium]